MNPAYNLFVSSDGGVTFQPSASSHVIHEGNRLDLKQFKFAGRWVAWV
jgi:hypothetical protein